MVKRAAYMINAITAYRILMAPVILFLAMGQNFGLVKWLVMASFLTDLVDGLLARRYRVTSVLGSRLDSIADDLTVLVAVVALFMLDPGFFRKNYLVLMTLVLLWVVQNVAALLRYRRTSSFHTYTAKFAAVLQGLFLILFFLLNKPPYTLFYVMVAVTALDLVEEIVLVLLLPVWKTDVRGLYWQWKNLQT